MPTIHRKYGGSTMARTLECPAWVRLADEMPKAPDAGSPAAQEGTALHDAMEWIMKNQGDDIDPDDMAGSTFNKIIINDTMVDEKLWPAFNAIKRLISFYDIKNFKLEPFVELIPELAGGSIDFIGISGDGKTMVVADYKFGFHVVSPLDNAQLLFYALCADVDPATEEMFKDVEKLSVSIIQPANDLEDGLDEWVVPVEVLDNFEQDVATAVSTAEKIRLIPNVADVPLESVCSGGHCTYCPAMPICPVKTGAAQAAMKLPDAQVEMLGEWLPKLDDLSAWIKSMYALAEQALEAGTKVEGYKMVAKRATRQWTDKEAVERKIKLMRGVKGSEQYDMKLKSPAQMEKLFKAKKVDFDKIADYIASVSTGSTMVKASDKRPEVLPVAAFKQAMKRLD